MDETFIIAIIIMIIISYALTVMNITGQNVIGQSMKEKLTHDELKKEIFKVCMELDEVFNKIAREDFYTEDAFTIFTNSCASCIAHRVHHVVENLNDRKHVILTMTDTILKKLDSYHEYHNCEDATTQ